MRNRAEEKPVTNEYMPAGEIVSKRNLDYATIFNATSNGMAFTEHATGRILDVNTAWVRSTGIPRENSIGRTASELGVWSSQSEREACIDELYKKGRVVDFEAGLTMKSSKVPHLISGDVVDMGGELCVLWEFRNISERKKAEEACRKSEEKFHKIFMSSPEAMTIASMQDGKYIDVNDIFLEITGFKKNEVVGHTSAELNVWVDPYERKRFLKELSKTGRLKGFKTRYRMRSGEIRDFRVSSEVIELDGNPCSINSILDITDRKRTEIYGEIARQVLQILNERGDLQVSMQRILATLKAATGFDAVGIRLQEGDDYPYFAYDGFSGEFIVKESSLVDLTPAGGIVLDADGRVKLRCICGLVISGKTDPASPFCTRGGSFWTNDSLPLVEILPGQDHQRNHCIHEGYASMAFIPIRNMDQIVGLLQLNSRQKGCFTLHTVELLEIITSHITAALLRKKAEGEREKLESQLIQAQKMEAVGQLAGGVAHDFNNILATIISCVYLLERQLKPADAGNQYVSEIREAADRAVVLTQNLLAFSRKQHSNPQPLDLNAVIRNTEKILARTIGEDIHLNLQLTDQNTTVQADSNQMAQILMNLAANARDAMPRGGTLTIGTERVFIVDRAFHSKHDYTGSSDCILMTVSDSGIGMDKSTMQKVFEPFFTTKEPGKGTGLGLSMVYGIVRQHNGFIDVNSSIGAGTTFKLYLPATESKPANQSHREQFNPEGATETILLVEDDRMLRVAVTKMLQSFGHTVIEACNGDEAITKFAEHRDKIHLVLMDVIMPGKSGRDTYDELKAIRPDLKIIFTSGYAGDFLSQKLDMEADIHFISKPVAPKTLFEKIRAVLSSKKA